MPTSSQNPTPEPMPDERFAEIRNRRFAEITPGPWLVSEDGDGSPVVYVEHQPTAGLAYARVLLTADYATEQDVQFVASARRSVPELVAEVERLRSEVTRLRTQVRFLVEQVRRKGAESGQGNRALKEFLAAPTPCSRPNVCEDGGDPCERHEREWAHAEGEHELCGDECDAQTGGESEAAPLCHCGHPEDAHGEQCSLCTVDTDWFHSYAPAGGAR